MRMLQALATYLQEKTGLPREKFTAFADQGELLLSGRDLGLGIEIGRVRYDAVIQIDGYPGDGVLLLAVIMAWLSDNDADRDGLGLRDPEIDVTLNPDGSADVDLAVEFLEAVEIVPDEGGQIEHAGRTWRVQTVPVDVAEDLENFEGASHAG